MGLLETSEIIFFLLASLFLFAMIISLIIMSVVFFRAVKFISNIPKEMKKRA